MKRRASTLIHRAAPVSTLAAFCVLPHLRTPALLVALLAGLLLTACEPATPPSRFSAAGTEATKTNSRAAAEPVRQELERLEREGVLHPKLTEQALRDLQARTPPGSLLRVELLALRGNLSAEMRDQAITGSVLKDLEDWPSAANRSAAKLAHDLVRGLVLRRAGERLKASKVLVTLPGTAVGPMPIPLLIPLLFRSHLFLAGVQAELGQFDTAIANAHAALKLADQSGQSWRRAEALSRLVKIYVDAEQLDRALATSAEALAEALRDPSPMLMFNVYTTRGIAYAERGDRAIAEQAKQQALNFARSAGADALASLALGNYADFHLKQGNFAQALKLSQDGLALARTTQNTEAELLAMHNGGIAKIGLNRLEEGKREVKQAIALEEQRGAGTNVALSWQELGIYLERAGDLSGAVEALHHYRQLIDKALRDDTRKAVLEAQENYDDERRAKETELLNSDSRLKTEQLRAHDLQLKLWAALTGCIVLLAALLGLAYQRIRKTNRALAHSNAALKIQGERDPLTGLANRRHFQAAIKRLADKGQFSGTVFLIDIDHFKRINDVHGHAAGDSVLVEVAQRLRAVLREEDLVVRWGGEEFLIVVAAREAAYASTLAQRLLDQIARPAIAHGSAQISVTASMGFASFPLAPHGLVVNWEHAIDLVDTAMYLAKAHGRNRAYGIESIAAQDEVGLQTLAASMEAAWREGSIKLLALQGPQADEVQVA
ncbi:diguanylate cyclase domain-containing protein [Roseateles sp. GG27B]